MNIYYSVLLAFLKREIYDRFHAVVQYNHIKENYPELFKLFQCVHNLHSSGEAKDYTLPELQLSLVTLYPNTDENLFRPIFSQLETLTVDVSKTKEYLQAILQRAKAEEIAKAALAVAEGTGEAEELQNLMGVFTESLPDVEDEGDFLDDDLEHLKEKLLLKPGLRWRLNSLNQALGSLRGGDFGFLFARPETGKTTFLASEVTYMASQADRPVLWFNNEEQGDKVIIRCYQASIGCELGRLYSNVAEHRVLYQEATKGNIKFVRDSVLTKKRVEQLIQKYRPCLVIYDQIDKIKGFHRDNERLDQELKHIYVWGRELAKTFDHAAIAVCQAGNSAEGKRWIDMGDVDNSKTGKQGEADWILGIGISKEEGLERCRYLHLSKNKLMGDPDTKPEMRHGKWEVRIMPEIARYEDY